MKGMRRLALFLILVLALAWTVPARASGLYDDKIVFGGTYTLQSGETLDGDLVVLGGVAEIESGSTVTGDVVLLGGTIASGGTVEGSVTGFGGLVTLADGSLVEGDVNLLGAHLDRAEGARVEGDITNAMTDQFTLTLPGGVRIPQVDVRVSPVWDALTTGLGFFFSLFAWAALAVLLVLFLPAHTEQVGRTIVKQPLVAGGLGLLTALIFPFALVIMIVSIILIPAAVIAIVLAILAWMFGLVALGLEVGKRIAAQLNQEWAPAASAGVGTFITILVLNGAQAVVPCVGFVFPFVAGVIGVGAVLLSRLGTQSYPPEEPAPAPASSEPPASLSEQTTPDSGGDLGNAASPSEKSEEG